MSAAKIKSRRQFLLRSSALIPVMGLSAMVQKVLAKGNDPQIQGIRKLSGDVKLNGQAAAVGNLVRAGDTITTGKGAEVIYVMGQDAYLQRESSTITFAKDALRVITGKLLAVFGKGNKQINVPTATIGIRGTGCYIEAEGSANKARTYFCLCYGTADITPSATPQRPETITTRHHDSPRWIHNDPTMTNMMVDAQVINHTDVELTLLEALVGRVPPFGDGGMSKY
ncbi:MAG TPA: hypothetical protein VL381_01385 [Rhodocyclaceae bacterium]|nr:hypothetical protein [Rhodocyclaceae bacterium]